MTQDSSNHEPPLLSGPTPGLVDPSQRSRLLRTPTSSLFFAAFDPHTARPSSFPNLSNLHIDPKKGADRPNHESGRSSNAKRIVIETDPENGTCSWRFVPRARMEGEITVDEDPWPRLVELCGRLVKMAQDQWDLYILDPEYDCLVRAAPSHATITRKGQNTNIPEPDATATTDPPPTTPKQNPASTEPITPTPRAKRDTSPTCSDSDTPRKWRRRKPIRVKPVVSSESDKMAVDEDIFYFPSSSSHKMTGDDVGNWKKRRRVSDRLGERSPPAADKSKGKAPEHTESSPFAERPFNIIDDDVPDIPAKKVRTHSAEEVRREMEQKRILREKKRKADMAVRFKLRRDGLERAFWDSLGVPPGSRGPDFYPDDESSEDSTDDEDAHTGSEDEAQRLYKIEESRRKLAELEKDKPLWEETARRRRTMEKEEEQMRQRAKAMKDEEERQRQQAQAARRQREERWAQERREREREARMREKSGRMFVFPPRGISRWTIKLALDRYLETAALFDATKYSATKPLTFDSIPWPMLQHSFSIQDIGWDVVEAFFDKVQMFMNPGEFKDLVEKSQRRYHPDRWRSRRLLASVSDETERDLLEVAGSTVAQALTPLWREITAR